jgi:hypothetical protein
MRCGKDARAREGRGTGWAALARPRFDVLPGGARDCPLLLALTSGWAVIRGEPRKGRRAHGQAGYALVAGVGAI